MDALSDYPYSAAHASHTHAYLWEPLVPLVRAATPVGRIFELGCGNGATAAMLAGLGYEVTGVDPSESGIRIAKEAHPGVRLEEGSAYDDLAGRYGRFPVVVSLEVVEHVYSPRKFARTVFDLLEPGGTAIISTPFHGYWKNLLIALAGKSDDHWTPLWEGGHIKFWSEKTLRQLLEDAGFEDVRFVRAGRIPPLAMSMIAVARRPA